MIELASVPLIMVICYFAGEFFKVVVLRKKNRYKFIPIIVGGIGGLLGLIIYYTYPELLFGVNNPFVSIGVGITSGLASTGGNEVVKQLCKKEKKSNGRDL